MKITYITHAYLLIEIQGIKILTDPWLKGPCWGGSLWHYPTHNYTIKKILKPDYIFFLMDMMITFMKKQLKLFQSHGYQQKYWWRILKKNGGLRL